MRFLFVFNIEPWFLPPAIEFIRVLKDRGYTVEVIYKASINKGSYDWSSLKINPYVISKKNFIGQIWHYNNLLSSLIKRNQFDFIILTDLWALQSAYFFRRNRKEKIIFWNFEILDRTIVKRKHLQKLKNIWFRFLTKKVDLVFTPSKSRKIKFLNWLKTKMEVMVILNTRSIDKTFIKINDTRTINILHSGSLSDIHFADKVYKSILYLPENFILHIAGIPRRDYEKSLGEFIKKHNLSQRVLYHGHLIKKDLDELIRRSHIGIVIYNKNKGISAMDPSPTKLGDYIFGGLLSVGTDQDYLKYWLDERGLGKTISEVTDKEIASAITELSYKLNDETSKHLEKTFLEEYNMDFQVSKFLGSSIIGK